MPFDVVLSDILRVLVPVAMTFVIGMLLTPVVTHYLYAFKAWKKRPGKIAYAGTAAQDSNRLHTANDSRPPRMRGIAVSAMHAARAFAAGAPEYPQHLRK